MNYPWVDAGSLILIEVFLIWDRFGYNLGMDEKTYKLFIEKYPKLDKIGFNQFYTKLWILLLLHDDRVTQTKLSSIRCKSLRAECPEFADLLNCLEHLRKNNFIISQGVGEDIQWIIKDTCAFEITKLKNCAELLADQKSGNINKIITNCSDDFNHDRRITRVLRRWGDLYPLMLKESAKGTIRVMFFLLFGV